MGYQRMGISACIPDYARHRDEQDRKHDPRQAAQRCRSHQPGLFCRLIFGLLAVWLVGASGPAPADTLRIATWNTELSRKGPGLLLRDILSGKDPQVIALTKVLARLDADVLALTNFDYDYDLVALSAFATLLEKAGAPYPFRFALRPNTGLATGLDLDRDGRRGGPGDAQGFGYFAGQGGMAILSRLPLDLAATRDFSGSLWHDLPGALLPENMAGDARQIQRLSTTGHWEVPLVLPDDTRLHLLFWHATPPVFDGPEDRNGRRNHDEAAFWLQLLAGNLPFSPPVAPFVLLGDANLDPEKGDGLPAAMTALLSHPRLQGLTPTRKADHRPSPDTAWFEQTGGLRLDYLLPSADLDLAASGIAGPGQAPGDVALFSAASRHFPLWADIALPLPPATSGAALHPR